jgi:hypothetical protein
LLSCTFLRLLGGGFIRFIGFRPHNADDPGFMFLFFLKKLCIVLTPHIICNCPDSRLELRGDI